MKAMVKAGMEVSASGTMLPWDTAAWMPGPYLRWKC